MIQMVNMNLFRKISFIAIKQDFWNKNFVFGVIGNEIRFWDFFQNLI